MKNELLSLTEPVYYLLFPLASVVPLGFVLAIIMTFYLAGMKRLKTAYWMPLAIIVGAVLLYIVFRWTIPFPAPMLVSPENIWY